MISYTRTNYMTSGIEASHQQFASDAYEEAGYAPEPAPVPQPQDIHTGTTYRPLLSDEEDLGRIEEEEAAAAAAEEAARRAEEEAAATEEESAFAEDDFDEAPDTPAEEEVSGEEISEEEAAQDEEPEEDEAEDIPEVSTSPLPPLKKAAISPRVLSYMEELERQQQRRSAGSLRMPSFLSNLNLKKKAASVPEEELPEAADIAEDESAAYEEPAYEAEADEAVYEEGYEESAEETEAYEEPAEDEYAGEADEEPVSEEDFAEDGGTYAGAAFEEDEADAAQYVSDDDSFESFEEADGEYDEPQGKFDLSNLLAGLNFKAVLENRIVKMSLAAALIVAVLIGGVIWLNYVTTKRSKVVDVTYSVYTQGIELLQTRISEEYRTSMSQVYLTNTGTANQHFAEDMAALNALMPAEPSANDELFITTLTIIQDTIVETIKADADAELNGTAADRTVTSVRDWQAIEDAVAKLADAKTPGELSVLAGNLESVTAPTATPQPEPTKDPRRTLTNGMMDDTDVKYMQNKLINLGYLEGEPDGDFGNGTEAAVKAFQRAAGLTADGIVTPAVLDAMEAEDAPRAPGSAAPSDPSAQ